jgi:3-oxoacyl-[acyl-carrier-protein] synthase-1
MRELVITAANSITAVGHDGRMTSACVRAGVSRLSEYDAYLDGDDNPIIAAPITGIGDHNRDTVTRLGSIAAMCLADMLVEYFQHGAHRTSAVKLFLGVASEERHGPRYEEYCLGLLFGILSKWGIQPQAQIISQGNASTHFAISHACHCIEADPDALCIVGGIDTLLRESTLNWFERSGRLKSASYGRHHGLIAGEAVSFLVIEGRARAVQAKAPVLACISGLGLAEEPVPRAAGGTPSRNTGLTGACRDALENAEAEEICTVFGDLNGENTRAREWSMAEMRVFKGQQQRKLWKPANCYGDIGAASGTVLANVVTQGFVRGWLPSPVLIFCSDDHGACGAVVLEKMGYLVGR